MLDRNQTEVDHSLLKLRDYSSHPDSIARIETDQRWRNEDKRGSSGPLQPYVWLLPEKKESKLMQCNPLLPQ